MGHECRSGSTLKKLEAEASSEATNFIRSWKWKEKIFYCFHISALHIIVKSTSYPYPLLDEKKKYSVINMKELCE